MALTPKQESFCLAYLETGNASEAYRRSYSASRMKDKQIWEESSKLLASPKVAQRLVELNASAVSSAVMTRQRALERLSLIAETSITDILEFDQQELDGPDGPVRETIWRMKDSAEIPDIAAATIKSVTMTKFGPKIEMYDRLSAIQQLSKMQGWEAAQKLDHISSDGSMAQGPTRIEIVAPSMEGQESK
jgi:phage terminase small subunit